MLEQLLSFGRKIIPRPIFIFFRPAYHWLLAMIANFYYGFPSRKLKIIGVTGTDGKTTTTTLITSILEEAGFKVGLINGLEFRIENESQANNLGVTMPGRFQLQKLLSRMLKAGCEYIVLEVTSEGIVQYRILGINFMAAVLTNLSPEHLDTHGTFEKYREAKGKLFARLKSYKPPRPRSAKRGGQAKKLRNISVINLDDPNAKYFLSFPADEKYGFGIKIKDLRFKIYELNIIKAENIRIEKNCSSFEIFIPNEVKRHNSKFIIHLSGEYNIYNALAASATCLALGVDFETIKGGLEKIKGIPGRMEEIKTNKGFQVFIDYAHTPKALEAIFKTAKRINPQGRLITVFGSAEGRDKIKRPLMGEVAARLTDFTILTTDESLGTEKLPKESPEEICRQIKKGFDNRMDKHEIIIDRRKAITKALEMAKKGDIVIIAGLGSGRIIKMRGEKKRWSDREIAEELLGVGRVKSFKK